MTVPVGHETPTAFGPSADDATGDRPSVPGQRISANAVVWAVTLGAAVVFWLIVTSWRPWELFARAGFSADFYDEQARAFLRGQIAVDASIPGPEGFLIDGRTYLYYGPFLAVVRLPLMLFGDVFVGRLVRVSMVLAVVVLCRWSARLARAARAVIDSTSPSRSADDRWALGLFTAAVACSPALFAAGWVTVYNETELWALTLAVIGFTLIAEWAAGGFTDRRRLVGACGAALAATLTRAPIGVGVSLGLIVCGLVLLWSSRRTGFDRGRLALMGGVAPVMVHAAVNLAKFGSLFSVPGGRQLLSLTDQTRADWFAGNNGSFFSHRFLPTTLAQYWRLDGIRFERLVPGVRFGPLAVDHGSYPPEQITPASSLPTSATLLLILAVMGVVWLLRCRNRTWTLLVVVGCVGAVPTFMIGFVANRYLIDMLPPLIVGGAVGAWVVLATRARRLVQIGGVALAVWGLWVNASLATWTNEYKTVGFTQLRYDIDAKLFSAPSPAIMRLEPGVEVPRDGVVALAPDCQGVYMSEQGGWTVLDRADGTRRSSGTIARLDEPITLATGPGWSLQISSTPAGGLLTLFDGTGSVTSTQPVAVALPAQYEVVVDDASGEYFARIDDAYALLPRELTPIRPAVDPPPVPSGLCLELSERL